MFEGTYGLNDSDIKVLKDCADCGVLMGTQDISGLGKRKQRNPKVQGVAFGYIYWRNSNWVLHGI